MARKTIKELEKEIEYWKDAYEKLNIQYTELLNETGDKFRTSSEYKKMLKEIELLEKSEDSARKVSAIDRKKLISLQNQYESVLHCKKYNSGNTEKEHRDYAKIKGELEKVTAKLEIANETISFLREYIREEIYKEENVNAVDVVLPKKSGRITKIDEGLIKRVKSYKKKKYTVRSIAQIEGISVGLAQKIIKGQYKR